LYTGYIIENKIKTPNKSTSENKNKQISKETINQWIKLMNQLLRWDILRYSMRTTILISWANKLLFFAFIRLIFVLNSILVALSWQAVRKKITECTLWMWSSRVALYCKTIFFVCNTFSWISWVGQNYEIILYTCMNLVCPSKAWY